MKNSTKKPSRGPGSPTLPMRRDLMSALAGVAAMGALPGQALAQAASKINSSSGHGSSVLSWEEYVDMLKPAGNLIERIWDPQSEQSRAELYRQFIQNIALGYFMYFQADPDHPDWLPFMNSVLGIQPCPDDSGLLTRIRGTGTYRVSGDRGTVHVLFFATGKNIIGLQDELGPGYNSYNADNLKLAADGSFEVIFSTERPKGYTGNWWYLHPEADFIFVRQRYYDWAKERPSRLAIERLDAVPLKPRMSKEEIDRNLRLLLGGFTRRLSKWALDYRDRIAKQAPLNTIYMGKHLSSGNSNEWPQYYWEGTYQIKADEALIVETDLPKIRPYWNAMMIDDLWNQVEFIYRQGCLNGHQARIDSDGKFRAVVSLEDPGVHNWLDTGGYLHGQIMGRWLMCDSQPLPTMKKVPLAEVRKHLPADTPIVSVEERAKLLQIRRVGGQLKSRW